MESFKKQRKTDDKTDGNAVANYITKDTVLIQAADKGCFKPKYYSQTIVLFKTLAHKLQEVLNVVTTSRYGTILDKIIEYF